MKNTIINLTLTATVSFAVSIGTLKLFTEDSEKTRKENKQLAVLELKNELGGIVKRSEQLILLMKKAESSKSNPNEILELKNEIRKLEKSISVLRTQVFISDLNIHNSF